MGFRFETRHPVNSSRSQSATCTIQDVPCPQIRLDSLPVRFRPATCVSWTWLVQLIRVADHDCSRLQTSTEEPLRTRSPRILWGVLSADVDDAHQLVVTALHSVSLVSDSAVV